MQISLFLYLILLLKRSYNMFVNVGQRTFKLDPHRNNGYFDLINKITFRYLQILLHCLNRTYSHYNIILVRPNSNNDC